MHPEFRLNKNLIYLNNAAVAPWPTRTSGALEAFARENAQLGASRYPQWLKIETELRAQLAWLLNAPSADDIALLKNTSEGLSVLAYGLDWKEGDNVVSIAQEFPSNRIVWESLQQQGVSTRTLDLYSTDTPEKNLIALCDNNTRLIAVSAVQYARGLKLNLEQIGEFCSRRNILFCVDAIQHLGAQPFDLQQCQADVVVADGHKWMLGPEGLALFYCRESLRDQLRLKQYGWHMVQHLGDYDREVWEPATSARRFECGSLNMMGVFALNASLSLLKETGMNEVAEKISVLAAQAIEQVDKLGFTLLSPRATARRAGIVTFTSPRQPPEVLFKRLTDAKVICAQRGSGIRFSPHFYNSEDDIQRAFECLQKYENE